VRARVNIKQCAEMWEIYKRLYFQKPVSRQGSLFYLQIYKLNSILAVIYVNKQVSETD
jgi:hypothetical protein